MMKRKTPTVRMKMMNTRTQKSTLYHPQQQLLLLLKLRWTIYSTIMHALHHQDTRLVVPQKPVLMTMTMTKMFIRQPPIHLLLPNLLLLRKIRCINYGTADSDTASWSVRSVGPRINCVRPPTASFPYKIS